MAVTSHGDRPHVDRDRGWGDAAAGSSIRPVGKAPSEPDEKYRDAHVVYGVDAKENCTEGAPLIADVVDGRFTAVPRSVFAAAPHAAAAQASPTNQQERGPR